VLASIQTSTDQIVGKPFQSGTAGPHSFSCLGVYIYLLREAHSIELEEPYSSGNEETIRSFWERHIKLPCFAAAGPLSLLYARDDRDAHVWTVEDSRWCVTSEVDAGVVRVPLREAFQRQPAAWILKELA
jgi:hypothetical protein